MEPSRPVENRRLVTKSVEFKLTRDEIIKRSKDAGILSAEIMDDNRAFDVVKKEYKAVVGSKEETLTTYLKSMKEGKETRVVECDEVMDYVAEHVAYYCSGEMVEERPMRPDEKQLRIVD